MCRDSDRSADNADPDRAIDATKSRKRLITSQRGLVHAFSEVAAR